MSNKAKSSIPKAAAERAWIDKNLKLFQSLLKNKGEGYIIGADFSLTSTGIVILNIKGELVHSELVKTSTNDGTKAQRLSKIRKRFIPILETFSPCSIFAFEMISVMTNSSVIDLAMSASQMLANLPEEERPFITSFAATAIKKAAIDDGKGDKSLILKGVYKKWGQDFDSDDLADAFICARLGYSLIKFSEIYFNHREHFGDDLEKFLLDFDKLRVGKILDELDLEGIDQSVAQVLVSLMKGKGVSIENDYNYYKEALKEIFQ